MTIKYRDPRDPEVQEKLQQERFRERLEHMQGPFYDDERLEFLRYRIEKIEDFLENFFNGTSRFKRARAEDLL